jgi:hypothetical protein
MILVVDGQRRSEVVGALTEAGAEVRALVRREHDRSRLPVGAEAVLDADPYTLLTLLSEDLFIGGLSAAAYEADRKSAR